MNPLYMCDVASSYRRDVNPLHTCDMTPLQTCDMTPPQVLLCNPLATAAFSYVSWRFFSDRIPYEEHFLCRYFPDYPAYRQRVPTRIPFIA